MRKSIAALSILAALGLTVGCQQETQTKAPEATALTAEQMTEEQKQAYALGASMGLFAKSRIEQASEVGIETDLELLKQGFQQGLSDTAEFDLATLQQLAQQGDAQLRQKQQEASQAAAEKNIEAGKAYLAENAQREGVMTTETGLQYEVLEEGTGINPTATDTVKVHYKGTLLDGTEFDSSYSRGEPIEFPLSGVIPGWTEGVQLMKEGAKYRFHIPSELAYGARDIGSIPPNSTLVFDVELLEVVKPEVQEASE